ncbi:hypothetical protein CC79DRAFT_1335771 [Sarocladium strictum]
MRIGPPTPPSSVYFRSHAKIACSLWRAKFTQSMPRLWRLVRNSDPAPCPARSFVSLALLCWCCSPCPPPVSSVDALVVLRVSARATPSPLLVIVIVFLILIKVLSS